MKTKKLTFATVSLVFIIFVYIVATMCFCYTTEPEITKGEFPFAITYEYKGETNILSGVLKCEYSNSNTIHGEHNRYWKQEIIYNNPNNVEYPFVIDQNDELMTTLSIQPYMEAGYFMGDPLYKDFYSPYGYDEPSPHVEYYDYKNDIYLDDSNKTEILDSIGFKVVDFTYAEPIENNFSFSGIQYEADNVLIFVAIMFVYLVFCLLFIRKDKELQYSKLDKINTCFNFIVGFIAIPLITFFCMAFGIVESHVEIINQLTYSIPPISILCLALSVVLRRKGFSKSSFAIQFGGIPLFILILVLDVLV